MLDGLSAEEIADPDDLLKPDPKFSYPTSRTKASSHAGFKPSNRGEHITGFSTLVIHIHFL